MSVSPTHLITGSNAKLEDSAAQAKIRISCSASPAELDLSCFMVGADGKVPSDDFFVFYNQPADPARIVQFHPLDKHSGEFVINLQALQSSAVDKCVFAVTLDGPGTFAEVSGCRITAATDQTELVYDITEGNAETSLVLAELYRHAAGFKLRAVGRGFHGGLKPLAEAHGVEVEDEAPAQQPATPPAASSTRISPQAFAPGAAASRSEAAAASSTGSSSGTPAPPAAPSKLNLTKIDLLKQKVTLSLRKKNIEQEKARVAVVIDASGSMSALYQKGVVQRAFERVLAVAASMDDDGILDVWFFGSKSKRMPSVGENDYEDYVKRTYPAPRVFGGLGAGNNEPVVMEDVIQKYTKESPSPVPTYVVFFSDGGIYETKKISKLLVESSGHNIFWQFVGIGNADYGVLRQLDDLQGRVVDNADFFALDDMDKVSDEELYDRLFNEYPGWLRAARAQGILQS
ncbi:VWA domain-containing protein [Paenibacillus albidus]|uniref:vWA domain-containing protein n=1 Tax=Paenibacillus albidus TaxID=2041023 RepID=UPI001BED3857|nr:VWA domain-containing protein [Paenibacillus albidus]MBT2293542.1 VWA domain-containing protein [Paenibacillus albidus]